MSKVNNNKTWITEVKLHKTMLLGRWSNFSNHSRKCLHIWTWYELTYDTFGQRDKKFWSWSDIHWSMKDGKVMECVIQDFYKPFTLFMIKFLQFVCKCLGYFLRIAKLFYMVFHWYPSDMVDDIMEMTVNCTNRNAGRVYVHVLLCLWCYLFT